MEATNVKPDTVAVGDELLAHDSNGEERDMDAVSSVIPRSKYAAEIDNRIGIHGTIVTT